MTKQIENNLNNQQQKQFDQILDQILGSEGGKVNDKNDRGGKTNRGITQKTYDSFCTTYGLPKKDVYQLTIEETKTYYRTSYQECKCDKITNPELAYVYFDAVVNHGQHRAVTLLQKSIGGVTVDGKIGKDTLSKANSGNGKKIAQQVVQERRNFYAQIIRNDPTQAKFEKGWANRMDKLNKHVENQVITSSQSRSTSASSNGSKGQVLQQEKNQGGIDCNPDIKNLSRIRGIEKMNARFLIDSQENIILSDLITVLSVYADPNIKPEHKGICFSLDPIILPNQREFTQQEKVCWPDKFVNRNIIQDSELAKVMFESDYLLKLMSLGVSADGVTPFQYPKQLIQLGLKPCLDFESAKNSNANKPLMFRFWLVPQQCSYSRKNDSFIINDIKVMCQSRQVERVNNNLQDKTIQDQNDISYKFAHKFTQLYDQIAQHYPIFNRLKQVFKAVALGKWMYQNNLKIDLQELMSYSKKVNNNPKTIPILKSEKKGEEQKTPVYFTKNEKIEKAKEYLKEKGHKITDDLIDQVVKQIPDLKGYKIESAILYTQGGIDPNCQNMEEKVWPQQQKNQDLVAEQQYMDIPFFPVSKCKDCSRCIENKLINLNQDKCSIHNDYTCYLCLELITQNDKDPKCLMINNKKAIFHKQCLDEYQKNYESTDDEQF